MTRWLGSFALLVAAATVVLLGLELGLRAVGWDPVAVLGPGRQLILRPSDDPRLRYELVPGASGRFWGTEVRINAHGFRGPELAADGAGPRVLVLGDSIAFGNGVAEDDVVSSQLARLLAERGRAAEVVNLGVGGFDTLQEAALLETRGLALAPDAIVLVYCLNDIAVVSTNLEYIEALLATRGSWLRATALGQFVRSRLSRLHHASWMERVNDPQAFRRSHAGRIADVDGDARLRALMDGAGAAHPSHWYRDPDKVGRLRFAFGRLAALAESRRIPLIVAIVPWLEEGAQGYAHQAAHDIALHEAARVGFESVDLLEPFRAVGLRALRRHPDDAIHPGARGHRLIAESVAGRVAAHLSP
ncbi:MAG: SGNH/GDSL hydrolase family protein [Myxococcota bacterium]